VSLRCCGLFVCLFVLFCFVCFVLFCFACLFVCCFSLFCRLFKTRFLFYARCFLGEAFKVGALDQGRVAFVSQHSKSLFLFDVSTSACSEIDLPVDFDLREPFSMAYFPGVADMLLIRTTFGACVVLLWDGSAHALGRRCRIHDQSSFDDGFKRCSAGFFMDRHELRFSTFFCQFFSPR
jgi:hypothetical protein